MESVKELETNLTALEFELKKLKTNLVQVTSYQRKLLEIGEIWTNKLINQLPPTSDSTITATHNLKSLKKKNSSSEISSSSGDSDLLETENSESV